MEIGELLSGLPGVCREIIIRGFLGWCELDFVQSITWVALPRKKVTFLLGWN